MIHQYTRVKLLDIGTNSPNLPNQLLSNAALNLPHINSLKPGGLVCTSHSANTQFIYECSPTHPGGKDPGGGGVRVFRGVGRLSLSITYTKCN